MLHVQPVDTNNHGETPDAVSPSVTARSDSTEHTPFSADPKSPAEKRFLSALSRLRAKKNGILHQYNKIMENLEEARKFAEQASGHNVSDADRKVLFTLATKALKGFRLKTPK